MAKSIIIAISKGKAWWIGGINSEKNKMEISFAIPCFNKGEYSLNLNIHGTDKKNLATLYKPLKLANR